jgi:hypothetical protein
MRVEICRVGPHGGVVAQGYENGLIVDLTNAGKSALDCFRGGHFA